MQFDGATPQGQRPFELWLSRQPVKSAGVVAKLPDDHSLSAVPHDFSAAGIARFRIHSVSKIC